MPRTPIGTEDVARKPGQPGVGEIDPKQVGRLRRKPGQPEVGAGYATQYRTTPGEVVDGQYRPQEYQIQRAAAERGNLGQWAQQAAQADYLRSREAQMQFGSQQQALAQMAMQRASGEGPSISQLAGQQALGRGLAQQTAMARSAPGVSPAMAQRMAMQGGAQMAGDVAQQTQIAELQERQQAEAAAAQMLAGARGQDLEMQRLGMIQAAQMSEADRAAALQMEGMFADQNLGFQQMLMNQQVAQMTKPEEASIWGDVLGLAGTIGGAVIGTFAAGPAGTVPGGLAGGAAGKAAGEWV